jgi:hypothetical protein
MLMASLLHLASIFPLPMRFGGPLLKSFGSWLHNFHTSKAALDLLMVLPSKFLSLGTIQPIKVGLMGGKKCIA